MGNNTSERLKFLMEERGLKQIDILNKCVPICEKFGVKMGRNDISQYVSGKVKPKQNKLTILAIALGVSEAWLMGYDVPMIDDNNNSHNVDHIFSSTKVPLYSAISCGTGIFVDDNVEEYLYIPDKFLRKGKDYFAVTAYGDSMVGKGIKSGDILVFEKTQILDNGEVGSFCIDENDAVCKVFRKLSTGIVLLESANDKYAPIEIDVSQDTCFRIIGRYKFKFSIEQED